MLDSHVLLTQAHSRTYTYYTRCTYKYMQHARTHPHINVPKANSLAHKSEKLFSFADFSLVRLPGDIWENWEILLLQIKKSTSYQRHTCPETCCFSEILMSENQFMDRVEWLLEKKREENEQPFRVYASLKTFFLGFVSRRTFSSLHTALHLTGTYVIRSRASGKCYLHG